jgi:ABC-2 type transport system ATP-binding protein
MTVVNARHLRKEFGAVVAVDDVSLSVGKGEVLGLIGPNGAGKTTLLKMLSGLTRKTSGHLEILGHPLNTAAPETRRHIGYLPDFFNLYSDLTLAECLCFFASAYGVKAAAITPRIEETLTQIDLIGKKDELVRDLSRGMMQRLGLGAALIHRPELFLLDEPASGLDPRARSSLWRLVRTLAAEGRSLVISSHILSDISALSTHIAIIDHGRLRLCGAVQEILHRVAGGRRLSIEVVDAVEKALPIIESTASVENARINDNTITFNTNMTANDVATLNARLVQQGIKVCQLREEKDDLEHLFMKLSDDTPEAT